ncbi:hypothetical protein [Marinoscillum sp. MHG1-6]|uniref:hypothetical protein n=1 Tax=Marinoscillum sp. MHG1-6 TaxID=2959627 RepID=UPI0021570DA6|nr:hypothetical protein [Marinoscillum sp. MHG1-6]
MTIYRSFQLITLLSIILTGCQIQTKEETFSEKKERILTNLTTLQNKIDRSIKVLAEEKSKKNEEIDIDEAIEKLELQKQKLERSTAKIKKSTENTLEDLSTEINKFLPVLNKELENYSRDLAKWLEQQRE